MMEWEEMALEYKILATRLTAERDMYLEYYEKGKETIAAYEELATNAVSLLKAAYSENDELTAKLTIANGALKMAGESLAEKDDEISMLRNRFKKLGWSDVSP